MEETARLGPTFECGSDSPGTSSSGMQENMKTSSTGAAYELHVSMSENRVGDAHGTLSSVYDKSTKGKHYESAKYLKPMPLPHLQRGGG